MDSIRNEKLIRILGIYTKLMNGEIVNKTDEAEHYGVNKRSIQRDIDVIRDFLDEEFKDEGYSNSVEYDRTINGYRLEHICDNKLQNEEILALCKILLDSRAFPKEEMLSIIEKLIENCVPKDNRKIVKDLVVNEEFHYIEPRHKTYFLKTIWEIGIAIKSSRYIEINYFRTKDKALVKRKVKPVAIMFSEFYFYLTAFIEDENVRKDFEVINDAFPTIYRIDRIKKLHVCEERFHIPYKDKFEEGEFRKRIQFMYGGKLQKVRFTYSGPDIDAVLDRIPTAVILWEKDGIYTISAEVFGKGIEMWFRSQAGYVEVIKME